MRNYIPLDAIFFLLQTGGFRLSLSDWNALEVRRAVWFLERLREKEANEKAYFENKTK